MPVSARNLAGLYVTSSPSGFWDGEEVAANVNARDNNTCTCLWAVLLDGLFVSDDIFALIVRGRQTDLGHVRVNPQLLVFCGKGAVALQLGPDEHI